MNKVFIRGLPRPTRLFVAPRPLPGHENYEGEWLRGCHYSHVFADRPDTDLLVRECEELGASEVIYVTDEELLAYLDSIRGELGGYEPPLDDVFGSYCEVNYGR